MAKKLLFSRLMKFVCPKGPLVLAVVCALLWGSAGSLQASPLVTFGEDLGNFPDAIAISAEFGTFAGLNINGDTINAAGFLFHLANTSFGDGMHSSFVRRPDGDFAVQKVLTAQAAAEIDAAQPFGIFSFGAGLPDGSGAVTSAPSGFELNFDPLLPTGLREVNFVVDLINPDGLIFDPTAPSIPSLFTNPRTGTFDFFISTPAGFTLDQLPQVRPDPGIDIMTSMAWASGGVVQTTFPNPGDELRPRGQLSPVGVPEPPTLLLISAGLVVLGWVAWRPHRRKQS